MNMLARDHDASDATETDNLLRETFVTFSGGKVCCTRLFQLLLLLKYVLLYCVSGRFSERHRQGGPGVVAVQDGVSHVKRGRKTPHRPRETRGPQRRRHVDVQRLGGTVRGRIVGCRRRRARGRRSYIPFE